MEVVENIVIVGAGIAGLATALGLHRMGIKCLVLESADQLRTSGFALGLWSNAWKALDELGVGDKLREKHIKLQELITASATTGKITTQVRFEVQGNMNNTELRGVLRNNLLEVLASELPQNTIRLGAKVVSIEELEDLKLLHLVDGSTLKTKVLVGCDGVNSIVAECLRLKKPSYTGRYAIRGMTEYPNEHGLDPNFLQYFGDGFRCGFVPSNHKIVYWFFTWSPSAQGSTEREMEQNHVKLKQFVLSKLEKLPPNILDIVERSDTSTITSSHLRFRNPLDILWGNVYKDNVCLAGDAFHAMTPDIAQGGCSALEDSIVLARCLGSVFMDGSNMERDLINKGVEKYVNERRWRCFQLITTAYVVGRIQQSEGAIMGFLRDRLFTSPMANKLLGISNFDCGKLPLQR